MTNSFRLGDATSANVRAEVARRRARHADLALALNMSTTALSRRMTGDVAFNVHEIGLVAEFLGVPVADLMSTPAAAAC